MGKVFEIAILALWSGVKYLYSAPPALAAGYSIWETIFITVGGAWLGTFFFYYFGGWVTGIIVRFIQKHIYKRKKPRKKFSKKNKFLVKIMENYGLIGLCIITPSMISIPVGCIVAARYFGNDKRTLPYMLISVTLWGCILVPAWSLLGF